MILKSTCFKRTIDLLLTNHKQNFMKSNVYETDISDHRKMIISLLRKTFAKGKPKTVSYRCHKNVDPNFLNETLNSRTSLPNLLFEIFFDIFQSTLNFFASCKQKKIRYNNNSFMTIRLREEIMIRSNLRNKLNKFVKL